MKNKVISLLKYYLVIFVVITIIINVFLIVLNKYALPPILNYVSHQTKKSSISVLRNSGLTKINNILDKKEVYKEIRNKNGEIESIDFDIPTLNNALIIVSKEMNNQLLKENNKNIVRFVPIGLASNNLFFSSTGPKVPIKIEYKGNVGLDLKTSVKPYGIDSALIEVYVYAEVTQITMIPFKSKEEKISSKIPIVIKVVRGVSNNAILGKLGTYNLP